MSPDPIMARLPTPPEGVRHFAFHRRNGYPAVVGILLVIVAVETAVAHLLLGLWTPIAAWISTTLGVYSGIWIWRDFRAARLHPIASSDEGLDLNIGLRWKAKVPWSDILAIHDKEPEAGGEPETTGGEAASSALRLTLFGAPDFWIELREPTRVVGPMGITRSARYLGVGADAASEFREEICRRIAETT